MVAVVTIISYVLSTQAWLSFSSSSSRRALSCSHDKTLQTKAWELARKAQGPGFLNRLHHQTSSHHHHHHHHWYHCLVLAVFFWNFISCDFLWEWIDSFQLERLITLPLRFSFRPAMTSDVIGENHSHLLHGHHCHRDYHDYDYQQTIPGGLLGWSCTRCLSVILPLLQRRHRSIPSIALLYFFHVSHCGFVIWKTADQYKDQNVQHKSAE